MSRDKTIDCIKGVCIIWVVLGHNGGSHPFVLQFCHPAVMGMFFLISGYLINVKLKLRRRLRTVGLQFCFFAAVSVLWRFAYGIITHESPDFVTWGSQLAYGEDFGLNIPMWFLLSYAEILALVHVVRRIRFVSIQWTVALVIMAIGSVMIHNSLNPFYLGWTMQYLPFFMLGQELHNYRHTQFVGRLPFLSILLIGVLIWGRFSLVLDSYYYLRVAIDTICALAVTVLLYNLFKNKCAQLSVLAYFGRNSLVILCVHILMLDLVWRLSYMSLGLPNMEGAVVQTIVVLLLVWPCCELYDRYIKRILI